MGWGGGTEGKGDRESRTIGERRKKTKPLFSSEGCTAFLSQTHSVGYLYTM